MAYYSNCTASFNPTDVSLVRGGDIHPQPGPIRQCKESAKFDIPKALKANVKLAHLNVQSLKSRENFCLIKDTILQNGFDTITVSETWADLMQASRSLVTNFSDRIMDNIKLEVACASTPSQTSRLLCLRIYHLPATMAFNNFG